MAPIEIRHTEGRAGDLKGARISNARAADELGWRAATPLREGVRIYASWLSAQTPPIAESAIVSTGAITRRNPLTRLATLAADTTFVTAAATVAVLSARVATVLGALDTSRAITYTTIGLSMLMPIFALLLVSWPHDRRRLQATAAATLATLAVITLGVASSDGDVHLSGEQIIAMLATSAAFTSAATALPARANRY